MKLLNQKSTAKNRKVFVALAVSALLLVVSIGIARNIHSRRRQKINFSRDIRPILNQNCVGCHGGVRQKANVSFIFRDEALGTGKSGRRTIVPGNPDASELMARVLSNDSETHMPYHGPRLSEHQINLLREWIKEGAQFDDYWAFVPPKASKLPEVKLTGWARQPLDRFVLARIEKEGLQPSPEADLPELLRRVSLDLTGLPPTPQEEAAFLADQSPNAYERQVDRLLASPRYGERWASTWLDLARYADSMGYEKDKSRPGVWTYRDWVVDAFNANLPYDEFVIRQLAGDLLPRATLSDRIATAFNRLTPNNDEGGTDDEEFRMVAVMDRVATTWSVTTGITMNCVQCHSHPYDPIRHEDYYKSLAFFNKQQDSDLTDDSPNLLVPPDKSKYQEASEIEDRAHNLVLSVVDADRTLASATQWTPLPIQAAAANEVRALEPMISDIEKRISEIAKNAKLPSAKRLDQLTNARKDLAEAKVELAHAQAKGGLLNTFTLRNGEAWANADVPANSYYQLQTKGELSQITALRISVPPLQPQTASHTPENGFIVSKIEAFLLSPEGKKQPIHFAYFAQDSEENFIAAEREAEKQQQPSEKSQEGAATVTVAEHPPTEREDVPSRFAALPRLFQTRWIVAVPDSPIYSASGSRIEVDLKQVSSIDSKPAQVQRIRFEQTGDPRWTDAISSHRGHFEQLFALDKQLRLIPTVPLPVMEEQQPYQERVTMKFDRGNFLTKTGPQLQPDTPAIFPRFPNNVPKNRLTLAQWFFDPEQPLTARVAANRYWEELFGTGIVETLENFGSVGEEPSHPELLDWLGLHFQNDLHWNMKALLREIVLSATYRQSSKTSPSLLARDPRNRLLARGPQQRLTAEMVRDQALLASGLLSIKMGGPLVMPPQPRGVWNPVYSNEKWTDASGVDRYRRALYTFVKRTSGYPSSLIFDASDRDTSLPRRIPTNTPLQALVTLNDPVFQEAAEGLAQRIVHDVTPTSDPSATLDKRLTYETTLVLSRPPTPRELVILRREYIQAMAARSSGFARVSFADSSTHDFSSTSTKELSAFASVATVLFNLDAALMR